ncbi:MAG: Hsp70 family protein, partial [Hyphomicrobiales bacterium]
MSHPPIGIDLGTTNSLVGAFVDGKAQLISNTLSDVLTPSVVSIDEDTVLVGQSAKDRLATHPQQTASVFKRKMGTGNVTKLARRAFKPEDLSSLVLSKLKSDAEEHLSSQINDVVVSVPAYFNQTQRQATRTA